jgi:hypothetical protein
MVAWPIIDRARRTSTFFNLSMAFPSSLASLSGGAPMLVYVRPSNEALLRARVPGAQDQRGCPSIPFIVRVPRAGGRPGYPSHPSETAHCASTGDHLVCPLLPVLCCRRRKTRNHPLPLLDDHLNAAVHGTPRLRVVAVDWVAVPVACGR